MVELQLVKKKKTKQTGNYAFNLNRIGKYGH